VLNDYQIQFLHHLATHGVRFLIVGGQARWLSDRGHKTRDLDVWVSVADADKPALERALVAWSQVHPAHTAMPLQAPLPLKPERQIAFPDCDGVAYMDRSGVIQELSTDDRIDVLTSLVGMDFEDCFARAVQRDVEGVVVRVMCDADLHDAAEHRTQTKGSG
jgi:hypothetical protein